MPEPVFVALLLADRVITEDNQKKAIIGTFTQFTVRQVPRRSSSVVLLCGGDEPRRRASLFAESRRGPHAAGHLLCGRHPAGRRAAAGGRAGHPGAQRRVPGGGHVHRCSTSGESRSARGSSTSCSPRRSRPRHRSSYGRPFGHPTPRSTRLRVIWRGRPRPTSSSMTTADNCP